MAQCVLNGSQVYWTMEVEDAFETESMKECVESLEQQVPGAENRMLTTHAFQLYLSQTVATLRRKPTPASSAWGKRCAVAEV